MHSISIRHNFEAAHRLPHLEGKCQSIHGHSFWAEVTIGTDVRLPESGIVVEYGDVKAFVRQWIDDRWDHATILGELDHLLNLLTAHGKVYRIGGWPTVETLAWHLGGVVNDWCRNRNRDPDNLTRNLPHILCESVTIRETAVNAATWINPEVH